MSPSSLVLSSISLNRNKQTNKVETRSAANRKGLGQENIAPVLLTTLTTNAKAKAKKDETRAKNTNTNNKKCRVNGEENIPPEEIVRKCSAE